MKEREQIVDAIKSYYKNPVMAFQQFQRLYELQPKIPEQLQQALVGYYNLSFVKTKEKLSFIGNYLFGVESTWDGGIEQNIEDTLVLYDALMAELPVFQCILDKVLLGEKLADAEIAKVMESTGYSSFTQQPRGERWTLMLLDDRKSAFLKAVYGVVVGISQRIVYIRRCGLDGCQKLFIPNRSGSEQIYCNTNHSKKAWALKKKLDATKDS